MISTKMFSLICVYLLVLTFNSKVNAITTAEVFSRHYNPIFVETGSQVGNGIQMAIEAGFQEIHSIEIFPAFYEQCCNRFKNNPNVHIYLGDSSIMLKEVLQQFDQPVTLWLDGHYSGGSTPKGKTNTPLLGELAAIADHPIKTHTILIDDVRCFRTSEFDFIELNEVIELIKQINPDYNISFEDGYVPKDVLVAEILH